MKKLENKLLLQRQILGPSQQNFYGDMYGRISSS